MQPDDELCLCFHVTRRKVLNYLRITRPPSASQLSECGGAGTGCGWCRPFLRRLWEQSRAAMPGEVTLPPTADYARQRAAYLRAGKGKPPASREGESD